MKVLGYAEAGDDVVLGRVRENRVEDGIVREKAGELKYQNGASPYV